ncbi:hypothetical protein AHAS_Ahas06G0180800 [Arachis hypogaea]
MTAPAGMGAAVAVAVIVVRTEKEMEETFSERDVIEPNARDGERERGGHRNPRDHWRDRCTSLLSSRWPSSSSIAVASPLKKRGRREHKPVAQGEELPPFMPPIAVVSSPSLMFG